MMKKAKSSMVEKTFGTWKSEAEGIEYVNRLRKGWAKREERLGIT